jgi:hypothetical protein
MKKLVLILISVFALAIAASNYADEKCLNNCKDSNQQCNALVDAKYKECARLKTQCDNDAQRSPDKQFRQQQLDRCVQNKKLCDNYCGVGAKECAQRLSICEGGCRLADRNNCESPCYRANNTCDTKQYNAILKADWKNAFCHIKCWFSLHHKTCIKKCDAKRESQKKSIIGKYNCDANLNKCKSKCN